MSNRGNKVEYLQRRISKLERLLISEMAEKNNYKRENERILDGSLAEYYRKQYFKLNQENADLKVKLIISETANKKTGGM